jgi:hypothetical protein
MTPTRWLPLLLAVACSTADLQPLSTSDTAAASTCDTHPTSIGGASAMADDDTLTLVVTVRDPDGWHGPLHFEVWADPDTTEGWPVGPPTWDLPYEPADAEPCADTGHVPVVLDLPTEHPTEVAQLAVRVADPLGDDGTISLVPVCGPDDPDDCGW